MYYFYFSKGLKTNYLMEDNQRKIVYEAKMEKLTLFKPYKFNFKNLLSNKCESYEISHRITKSKGIDKNEHEKIRIMTDSHIKINGENNWEYLKKMGYNYAMSMDGLKPCYTLYRNEDKIAEIKTTGSDVHSDKGVLSKLPVNGNYQVECNQEDLDIVFMFCFMVARASILEGDE